MGHAWICVPAEGICTNTQDAPQQEGAAGSPSKHPKRRREKNSNNQTEEKKAKANSVVTVWRGVIGILSHNYKTNIHIERGRLTWRETKVCDAGRPTWSPACPGLTHSTHKHSQLSVFLGRSLTLGVCLSIHVQQLLAQDALLPLKLTLQWQQSFHTNARKTQLRLALFGQRSSWNVTDGTAAECEQDWPGNQDGLGSEQHYCCLPSHLSNKGLFNKKRFTVVVDLVSSVKA